MTAKNGIESSVKKRVLLVDDEARVRASLKAVLEPTYEVIQAADAQEGLDLFHKEAPHRRPARRHSSRNRRVIGSPDACGRSRTRPPSSC